MDAWIRSQNSAKLSKISRFTTRFPYIAPTSSNRWTALDKNDALNLRHMVSAIEQLESYMRGMSESEFAARVMVQDAAAYQVRIVSETAKNMSVEFQQKHPKVPWGTISRIHSKIIGEDYKLNISTAWDVIQDDLPLLKHTIRKLMLA
jgi:uncharacterized protein with HEPN domain